MSLLKPENESEQKQVANRRNAQKSTGPRTNAGKKKARLNALKHGARAGVTRDPWLELEGNPNAYSIWRRSFMGGFAPEGPLAKHLVDELSRLEWKRALVDRAQGAMQAREIEMLELAALRNVHRANCETLDLSQEEIMERGIVNLEDSTAKFEEGLNYLDSIIKQLKKPTAPTDSHNLLKLIYGKHPTTRGNLVMRMYDRLRRGELAADETEQSLRRDIALFLDEECRDLLERYSVLSSEQVRISVPLREACLAPTDPRWALLLRQEAMLERQIDRRLSLLERLLRTETRAKTEEKKYQKTTNEANNLLKTQESHYERTQPATVPNGTSEPPAEPDDIMSAPPTRIATLKTNFAAPLRTIGRGAGGNKRPKQI